MSHSLNEQVVTIPAGTGADNLELLLETVKTLTGWTREDTTIYPDAEKTFKITFELSNGNSANVMTYFNNTVALGVSVFNVPLTSQFNVRCHKSKTEKTTYISFHDSKEKLIYSVNAGGVGTLVRSNSTTGFLLGTKNKTTAGGYGFAPTKNTGIDNWSIAQMPDYLNNSLFPELYFPITYDALKTTEQLVSFSGEPYRIVTLSNSTSGAGLAFPVSN